MSDSSPGSIDLLPELPGKRALETQGHIVSQERQIRRAPPEEMMTQHTIGRGHRGTYETLQWIKTLGIDGALNSYVTLFTNQAPVRNWDLLLRQYWQYEPEAEETLRTINRQVQNLITYQKLIGDCDDAAIVAIAMAESKRQKGSPPYPFLDYRIVAVRRPEDPEFSHVFVEILLASQLYRIDPTAPVGADYTNWERMVL